MTINFSKWSHKGIDMDAAVWVLPPPDFLPVTVNVETNHGRQTFLWEDRKYLANGSSFLYQFSTSEERLCGLGFAAPPWSDVLQFYQVAPLLLHSLWLKRTQSFAFDISFTLNRAIALAFCVVCNAEGDNWDALFTDDTSSQLVRLYQTWRQSWHVEYSFLAIWWLVS